MKKILSLFVVLLLVLTVTVSASASAHDGLCGCGREYAREDSDDFLIYDCLGCGRNYTSCTCKTCWCGSDLHRDESVAFTTCDGCGLPCEDCICRDRSYYDALQKVEQGLTGEEVPNPENGIVIALACLLPFGAFLALYFTIYRRRSVVRNRKNRPQTLEKELDAIDREPDAKKRYLLAKEREESKRDGDTRILDREGMLLCLRKNELLASALEEEWMRDRVAENLRTCRDMNRHGFVGSVETVERLWDFKEKKFSPDRREISGESPAQCLVKWDTKREEIALFEIVTSLNGPDGNLLRPASNITRFGAKIFDPTPVMNRKTDPSTEQERRQTLQQILPGCDTERLLHLDRMTGKSLPAPAGLPSEASPRRVGEKTRFPGGTLK